MAQGIILAGGYSSRIGHNKMTLSYQGTPIILHCIHSMMPFVSHIFVISGHYHDELTQLLKDDPKVTIIYNELYHLGMFSSVKKGSLFVTEDFFIIPGDYPLIMQSTYLALLKCKEPIAVPVFQNKKGHPIFIKKELIEALRNEPLDSNLKLFRNRFQFAEIQVDDSGILLDIDTLEDHEHLITIKGVNQNGN